MGACGGVLDDKGASRLAYSPPCSLRCNSKPILKTDSPSAQSANGVWEEVGGPLRQGGEEEVRDEYDGPGGACPFRGPAHHLWEQRQRFQQQVRRVVTGVRGGVRSHTGRSCNTAVVRWKSLGCSVRRQSQNSMHRVERGAWRRFRAVLVAASGRHLCRLCHGLLLPERMQVDRPPPPAHIHPPSPVFCAVSQGR